MKKTRFGWVELIIGTLMILLGIYTLFRPGNVLTGLVRVYAVIAILSGMRDIVFYCRSQKYVGLFPIVSVTAGIISLMAGIMLLAYPGSGSRILTILIPIWILSHSIFQIASLERLRFLAGTFSYRTSIVAAIIGLLFGLILLFNPGLTVVTSGVLVGIYLIIAGINSIAVAFSKTGFREDH